MGVPPRHKPCGPSSAAGRQPLSAHPIAMVNPGPLRPPRLVAEALGTGAIPSELSMILADHFRTVREDGAALSLYKRLGQGRGGGGGGPLLPGASSIGGGRRPRPGAGDIGRCGPRRNGASHALAILRQGQHVLNHPTSLRLPG